MELEAGRIPMYGSLITESPVRPYLMKFKQIRLN